VLTNSLRDLVTAATTHAVGHNDNGDHTVAAALLTRSGRTVLGLSTRHFPGGPCGETSALSNHAATCPDDPITAMATVHGASEQVVAPCGSCRQELFDLDPSIQCVMRDSSGLKAVPVSELLPFAHDWNAVEQPQKISMWEGYEASIRDGSKRQTIRIDDPFRRGPAQIVFKKGTGEVVTIDAFVTSVIETSYRELTEEQARRDGFASLAELHQALNTHYPDLAEDDLTDVVSFEIGSNDGNGSVRSRP
jgi:cytidine deaminase